MTDAAINDAELKRQAALVDADAAALDELLAKDFRYVHATGRVESRGSYLEAVAAGKNKFLGFEQRDVSIDRYGNVAVATGALAITLLQQGNEQLRNFRYVAIWVASSSGWQLSFWQSTSNTNA
jgi:ketosteroid isomerase-like protein